MSNDAAWFFSLFHTKHAVGLIALSHVSEHIKEILENQDKPKHRIEEKQREDMIRIYGDHEVSHTWPKHIRQHRKCWEATGAPKFHFVSEDKQISGQADKNE